MNFYYDKWQKRSYSKCIIGQCWYYRFWSPGCRRYRRRKSNVQPSSKPIFRFLQINDLHIESKKATGYEDANIRASWLFDAIREEQYFPKPDFILGIGGIINGESLEGIKNDFSYLRENFLDDLSIPFYPVMGNHECQQQEGNPEFEAPYVETYGLNRLNYSFEYKGIKFIA